MNSKQPKPDSKQYSERIAGIEKGIIKIPKFQREFVWGIDRTAERLDSILKRYPIGACKKEKPRRRLARAHPCCIELKIAVTE